jgi:hypothetical protein
VEQMGIIQRDQLFQLVAQDIGGEYYDLSEFEPAQQVLMAVPQERQSFTKHFQFNLWMGACR